MQKHLKKNGYPLLEDVYAELGCRKTDISRWEYNLCSTHALCKKAKITVIEKAALLFGLTGKESELLANKAGLSLSAHSNCLADVICQYDGKYCELLEKANISERMFQYYMAGKEPTKQALLAIFISLDISLDDMQLLLKNYGYCISSSLPNDAIVRWYLQHSVKTGNVSLLYLINEVLDTLDLPILATKLIRR